MQTNGTLLREEAVDFLVDNGFNLGFSLDGIQIVNYPNS
jgi:sulfatase maturation enzyme AslB (radical SAM superfamily)